MSHTPVPCSLLLIHTYRLQTCINNIHTEIEQLFLHINECLLAWNRWTDAACLSNARCNQIHGVSSQLQAWFFYLYWPGTSCESHSFFQLWTNYS